jgi:hypothetical protein
MGKRQLFCTIIDILDIIHHAAFFIKNNVSKSGILSPSSGKSLFCWAQSTELIYISGVGLFYLKTETESSLRNFVFNKKPGRWIMSKRSIIILMSHRHKLLETIANFFFRNIFHREERSCVYHFYDVQFDRNNVVYITDVYAFRHVWAIETKCPGVIFPRRIFFVLAVFSRRAVWEKQDATDGRTDAYSVPVK